MLKTFLRNAHNTIIMLAVGIVAVSLFYLGGAALLALTFAALVVTAPLVGPYAPDALTVLPPNLLFAGAAAAVMLATGAMLAHPVAWTLNKLDTVQRRLSFS